jgi:hypothetical protein
MPYHQQLPSIPPPIAPGAPLQPRSRNSSPISTQVEEIDVLRAFFDWKIEVLKSQEQVDKWARIKRIILDQDWTIVELKSMEEGSEICIDALL